VPEARPSEAPRPVRPKRGADALPTFLEHSQPVNVLRASAGLSKILRELVQFRVLTGCSAAAPGPHLNLVAAPDAGSVPAPDGARKPGTQCQIVDRLACHAEDFSDLDRADHVLLSHRPQRIPDPDISSSNWPCVRYSRPSIW
jgi:hypothetical protein